MITGQTQPNFTPVSQQQLLPQMAAPANPLRQRSGPFNKFVQQVSPTPIPKKWQFYRDAFTEDFVPSYQESNQEYFNKLKHKPIRGLGLAVLSGLLSLPMIAFHAKDGKGGLFGRNTIRYMFALSLLAYPIYQANKLFPKLEEAYKHVQQGNPTQGRQEFREALGQTILKVYHNFAKPLTFAGIAAYVVMLPKFMPNASYKTVGWVEPAIRKIAKMLGKKQHGPILKPLDKLGNAIERQGELFEQGLLQKVPLLHLLKQSQ